MSLSQGGGSGGGGGGATPGGSTGQVQNNNGSGGFGAIAHGAVGSVLRQTGATTQAFGQLDLADTDAVTGVLPEANQADQTMGGDVTGTTAAAVVAKVNGVSYPSGAATVGQVPRVTGTNTVAYGALDLADSDAVTGVLPSANAPSHAGDVTGAHSATVVAKVNGVTYPSGATTVGTIPRVTGSNVVAYGALDLANANARTGLLPLANQAAPTGTGFARVTSGAWDAATIGDTGTGNVVRATSPTIATPTITGATSIGSPLSIGTDGIVITRTGVGTLTSTDRQVVNTPASLTRTTREDLVSENTTSDASNLDFSTNCPDGGVSIYHVRVTAVKSDNSEEDAWVGEIRIRRNGGVLTESGKDVRHVGAVSGWTVDIGTFAGTAMVVRCNGAAATTIRWTCSVSRQTTMAA